MTVPLERQKNIADVGPRVREQLGLGSASVEDATAFATSAQGEKADSALPANELPIYASRLGMPGLEVPAGISAANVNGEGAASDGRGGRFFEVASQPYHPARFKTANNRWFEKYSAESLSDKLHALINSGVVRINCIGTSLTYGYDTVTGGGLPPINGSTTPRSQTPYPESLLAALSKVVASPVVNNCGYSGDTAITGWNRWYGNLPEADIWLIEYATNESTDYGAGEGVPHDYRRAMQQWIDYALSEGAIPVILGAPGLPQSDQAGKVRAFSDMARRVAQENSVWFIDIEEQIRWIAKKYTDGTHLTAAAYAEWGVHLAAMFTARNGKSLRAVGPGDVYYPSAGAGLGGGRSTFAQAESGVLGHITQSNAYVVGVYATEDVFPVITFYNASGIAVDRAAAIQYGVSLIDPDPLTMSWVAAPGPSGNVRRRVVGPLLRKGMRTYRILPTTAESVFIEKIEYISAGNALGVANAMVRKSNLAGICVPPQMANKFSVADFSIKVRGGSTDYQSEFCAHIQAPAPAAASVIGIGITKDQSQRGNYGGLSQIMMLRSGSDLIIRTIDGGVVSDTVVASVFTAGAALDAMFEMKFNSLSRIEFWVNGNNPYTLATPAFTSGYPAFHCLGSAASGIRCNTFVVTER